MKYIKNGTIILIVGVIGLLIIIGTVFYGYFDYLKPPQSYTPQQIAAMESEPININTAAAEELRKLPGLTSKQAQSLVDYREENGSFTSPQDILKVKGIGKKTYQKIVFYITAE